MIFTSWQRHKLKLLRKFSNFSSLNDIVEEGSTENNLRLHTAVKFEFLARWLAFDTQNETLDVLVVYGKHPATFNC